MLNLAQLDQLGELLGNVAVPVGTYTAAIITVSANQGDIQLTAAADPEAGFGAAPGASIPASQIQIQGAQGMSPNLTVPVHVDLQSPLVVSTTQNNALELEFDLGHPAFIVEHTPPGAAAPIWAINFNGPVRHRTIADLAHLLLRHMYGTVSAVASDGSSLTITRDLPALPIVNPESAVATTQSLQILADAANGTLFFDLDANTSTTIKSFSSEASVLAGKYVRIAARYQEDGTLVAVRVWVSSRFDKVWLSPEGHVLHVDTANNVLSILNESGMAVPVQVNSGTEFFFRQPGNGAADATPIATGTAFISNHNLVRGFKVHVSAVDPLANTLVAQSVDIETPVFDGRITAASASNFTDTRVFRTASDDYSVQLGYISAATANGKDANGNPVSGFRWWNFTFPTMADTGANAVPDFVTATTGAVSFGGTAAPIPVWGASYATWGDPANSQGWSVRDTVLLPAALPLGSVVDGFTTGTDTFTMTVPTGANAVTVDVGTTAGSATLAYQVDNTNGIVTVSPVDLGSASGQGTLAAGLVAKTPVKVFGIPQVQGTLKAYVILYYTGTLPTS
ncbi:MAG: hypothetical protein JOZ12_01300 [Sinobacteraceae bacterium]|nr:hypothetical protein [Nevskiaceae bacterium]